MNESVGKPSMICGEVRKKALRSQLRPKVAQKMRDRSEKPTAQLPLAGRGYQNSASLSYNAPPK